MDFQIHPHGINKQQKRAQIFLLRVGYIYVCGYRWKPELMPKSQFLKDNINIIKFLLNMKKFIAQTKI